MKRRQPGTIKKICSKCGAEHYRDGKALVCYQCHAKQTKVWRKLNPEKAKEAVRKYHRTHPGILKAADRKHHLITTYGITVEQYESLLASQGGVCAICGSSQPNGPGHNFHVDHDHVSLGVRGLLCSPCNLVLGLAKDNPELLRRIADYCEKGGLRDFR